MTTPDKTAARAPVLARRRLALLLAFALGLPASALLGRHLLAAPLPAAGLLALAWLLWVFLHALHGVLWQQAQLSEIAARAYDEALRGRSAAAPDGAYRSLADTPPYAPPSWLPAYARSGQHLLLFAGLAASAWCGWLAWRSTDTLAALTTDGLRLLALLSAMVAARGVALAPGLGVEGPEATVHLALGGRHLAAFRLADTLRPEAKDALAALRAEGIGHITLLTGDRPEVAGPVAAALGIERLRARCLPADKLAEVEALKKAGHRVLVVGDGVNDAPALAAGHLGVAMGAGGAEIAVRTADVALMTNDLSRLAFFFRLSRRATDIINQNLALGAPLIALFVTLSTLGLVSPVGAALLHELSAFVVLLNSARLLRATA